MPRIAPFEVPAPVVIGEEPLTVAGVVDVARHGAPVRVAPAAFERVAASRALIERLADDPQPHYGISTGFGALATTSIPPSPKFPSLSAFSANGSTRCST